MKQIERLQQAINESAATTMLLTRKASDNQQNELKSDASLELLKNDLLTHDKTATVTVDDETGAVSISSLLGPNAQYIARKHGYMMSTPGE